MRAEMGQVPGNGGNVLVFRRKNHGCIASRGGRACIAASVSNVIPFAPRSTASVTISAHRSEGIRPRERQLETTGGSTASASASSEVPPKASMTESGVMPSQIFTFCEAVNHHVMAIAAPDLAGHDPDMAKRYAQIGKRLIAVRQALGISQAELCRQIKCQPNRWNQYESGERRITVPISVRLADTYGASMDWVYRGDPRGLTQELFAKIQRAA